MQNFNIKLHLTGAFDLECLFNIFIWMFYCFVFSLWICLRLADRSFSEHDLRNGIQFIVAREPGFWGSNDPGNLPRGQTWYFDPRYFGKNIIIILYSETRSRTVFLLSFITDMWTPRNVALMILTPSPSQKIVPARLITIYAIIAYHLFITLL